MKKLMVRFSQLLIIILMLTSCSPNNKNTDEAQSAGNQNEAQSVRKQNKDQPMRVQKAQSMHKQNSTIQPKERPFTVKQAANIPNKTAQLAGGSEASQRNLRPISNYILQQKFPNIIAMRGSSKVPSVALTFDDGPDGTYTPQVLNVLKKHNVKATFFLMGSRVAGHRDVTRRIHNEGHSIGNHTYWHPKLFKEGAARMRWEVTQTDAAIKKIVGFSPKLFRAPYGSLNEELVTELGKMKFSVIGWTVDSMDWKQLDSKQVQNNVLANIHPGAVILMHSGGNWTQDLSGMVQALDVIIPRLKKQGIKFVTIPELLNVSEKK